MRYYGYAKSLGETPKLDCVELSQHPPPPPSSPHAALCTLLPALSAALVHRLETND